jgi:hypothetical protein
VVSSCGNQLPTLLTKPIQPPSEINPVPTSTQFSIRTDIPLSISLTPEITSTVAPIGWCTPPGDLIDDFLVIGYLPDYRSLEPTWGNCLTDVIYFSADPLASGELDTQRLQPETLVALRQMKETHGTRIHISLGGYRRSEDFGAMVTNKVLRAKFVENLIVFAALNDLDGIDFDWEFPETQREVEGYIELIKEIGEHGLITSVALFPSKALDIELYSVADRIHVMSYNRGVQHSTYQQAVEDLAFVVDRGIPIERLILGVPFYGRQTVSPYGYFTYAEIIESYRPPFYVDEIDNIYFNGVSTVAKKTCFVLQNNYRGIMIWELGQDSSDETSLLQTIYRTIVSECR